jgi:small multidrug resistance pump
MTKLSLTFCCTVMLLLAVLVQQTSAAFHPVAFRASKAFAGSRKIGSGWAQDHDAALFRKRQQLNSIMHIRGGGVTSMISDFNEYIGASKFRSWAVLAFSIMTDTCAVTLMKTAQAESSMNKLILSFVGLFVSLSGFALALKSIDVSIAYAVWAATGTAIVSIAGVVFFGERLDLAKIICISMIVLGVVGLELTSDH